MEIEEEKYRGKITANKAQKMLSDEGKNVTLEEAEEIRISTEKRICSSKKISKRKKMKIPNPQIGLDSFFCHKKLTKETI
ncbi:hypothetical protein [Flavobacterium fluviatile]|uniref:hypothetical protein n=1 Tax=Flavobacterium fluviatile TaxID=1862387 RepID=UPI0013D49DC1|nr:hypothetical protein [Flavobacterium fluviatile]